MATTVASFSAIDDTAIDAESPIVESMMKQLRDNSYWIDAGTRQTTETSTTKVLTPNGSGGVAWVEVGGIASVDGTKGTGGISVTSGSPTIIAIQSGKKLFFSFQSGPISSAGISGSIFVDADDDTYVACSSTDVGPTTNSGTITGSFVNAINTVNSTGYILLKKNGSNYEMYENSTGGHAYCFMWF